MIKVNNYILLITLMCLAQMALGQEENPSITDIQQVQKEANIKWLQIPLPSITIDPPEQAEPSTLTSAIEKLDLEHDFGPIQAQIRPLRYSIDREIQYYDGFLDLAYGTPNQIRADIGYHYFTENWYGIGGSISYNSITDPSRFQTNARHLKGQLFGEYFINSNTRLSANAKVLGARAGLRDSTLSVLYDTIPEALISQRNQGFSFSVSLDGYPYSEKGLLYGIKSELKLGSSRDSLYREQSVTNTGFISKEINDKASVHLHAYHEWARTNSLDSLLSLHTSLFHPNIKWQNNRWTASGGVYGVFSDSLTLWPALQVSYRFDESQNYIELQSRTQTAITSLHDYFMQMPVVSPVAFKSFLQKDIGLKLNLKQKSSDQSFSLLYAQVENDLNVVYDTSMQRVKANYVDYEKIKIGIRHQQNINTTFDYQVSIGYNLYLEGIASELSLLPETQLKVSGNYKLFSEKLVLSPVIYYLTRNDIVRDEYSILDDPIWDLNFLARYNIKENISIYFEGRNLLGKEYLQYENYFSFQRQLLGGFRYLF